MTKTLEGQLNLFEMLDILPGCGQDLLSGGMSLGHEEFPEAVVTKHFGDEDLGIEGDLGKYTNVGERNG